VDWIGRLFVTRSIDAWGQISLGDEVVVLSAACRVSTGNFTVEQDNKMQQMLTGAGYFLSTDGKVAPLDGR
jgi:hypothetical protein